MKVKANKKESIVLLAFKGHTNHPYPLEGVISYTTKYQKMFNKNLKSMQIRYRRYTKDTDDVIMKYVHRSPNNLKQAFRWAAFHLNRPVRGIEQRYYNHLYYNSETNEYYRRDINGYGQKPKKESKEKDNITINVGKYSISIKER